ncbi:Hypothetical protein mma_1740 [Janthinobacterium sp. Marseille]|nr:hypothetical protein [Janthinobacterium sp. Marseille]ABR91918.1 Hypothetical protein mma_1740 [Janthinobacterium sp. Marseille]
MNLGSILVAEYVVVSRGNGGGVIILRAAIITIELLIASLIGIHLIDGTSFHSICDREFWKEVKEVTPWFAATYGAVYAALYTRFSSQWTYLASLYNQIKQAEFEYYSNKDRDESALHRLAEWKAGYIEDAFVMHLAKKGSVKQVIRHWAKEKHVGHCLKHYSLKYDILRELDIDIDLAHESFLPFPGK